jgi:hypothetical protein
VAVHTIASGDESEDDTTHTCHWCRNERRWLIGAILFEAAGVIGVIVCWYLYLHMKGSK